MSSTEATLRESAADVAALIPRYSWEIMDETQRDDLMTRVIVPRYMARTIDGVELGPRFWSELVGATPAAIKHRMFRLRQSERLAEGAVSHTAESEYAKSRRRAAQHVLRERPEAVAPEIAAAMADPKVAHAVHEARREQHEQIAASLGRRRGSCVSTPGPSSVSRVSRCRPAAPRITWSGASRPWSGACSRARRRDDGGPGDARRARPRPP